MMITLENCDNRYVLSQIQTLAQLHELRIARQKRYEAKGPLTDYILFGRWMTDACGNVMPITELQLDYKIDIDRDELAPVIANEELKVLKSLNWSASHRHYPSDNDKCVHCLRGWDLKTAHSAERARNPDTETYDFIHINCHIRSNTRRTRKNFEHWLIQAGIAEPDLSEVPNQYSPGSYWTASWFLLHLPPLGTIKFGWRKSVINIDWSDFKKDLMHLFKDEEVTKDPYYIHAWGYEKFSEYMKKIIDELQKI